jgi:hypothetical protein
MAAVMTRLGKHVPAAADTHTNVEELLETAFSILSVQIGYITRTPAWELA